MWIPSRRVRHCPWTRQPAFHRRSRPARLVDTRTPFPPPSAPNLRPRRLHNPHRSRPSFRRDRGARLSPLRHRSRRRLRGPRAVLPLPQVVSRLPQPRRPFRPSPTSGSPPRGPRRTHNTPYSLYYFTPTSQRRTHSNALSRYLPADSIAYHYCQARRRSDSLGVHCLIGTYILFKF